ncbi:MAG: hypothetical protein K2X66_05160 [Cyanobacteria bacterium]|nr:hypothetical protein [Cyanobacteriota bacterium]
MAKTSTQNFHLILEMVSSTPENDYVYQGLVDKGQRVFRWDLHRSLSNPCFSYMPASKDGGYYWEGNEKIPLNEFSSVYCLQYLNLIERQRFQFPPESPGLSPAEKENLFLDTHAAIGSFLEGFYSATKTSCQWVNRPLSNGMHLYKSYQLQQIHQFAGVAVPQTLMTQNSQEILAFAEALPEPLICKPCYSFDYANMLWKKDLTDDYLAQLAQKPRLYQGFVPGIDIVAFVVGPHILAVSIEAEGGEDYRKAASRKIQILVLPEEIQKVCHKIHQLLGLTFSAIDFRRTPEGKYVFLEANPSPLFLNKRGITGDLRRISLAKLRAVRL